MTVPERQAEALIRPLIARGVIGISEKPSLGSLGHGADELKEEKVMKTNQKKKRNRERR